MQTTYLKPTAWLDRKVLSVPQINIETLLYLVILALAVFSRFFILEARVMSHDENSHVYYSWRFYRGEGFQHDPLMHGPLQFHLVAASYFMFGDNDFTARIPAALFSVATVMFMWFYRRYLGRAGALIGAALMLISPYMMFYGRYVRNEAFVALFGVVMLWAMLRFIETGKPPYLYLLTAVNVLHFTTKETSFIYTAQAMLFLGFYFIYRVSKAAWKKPLYRDYFLLALIAALILVGAAGGVLLYNRSLGGPDAALTGAPAAPGEEFIPPPASGPSALLLAAAGLAGAALLAAAYFLIRGCGWESLKRDRAFGMLIVFGTLVLPQLAAFPVRLMGWKIPTNASDVMALTGQDILQVAAFLVPLFIVSVVIGLLWNARLWLINAAIWYGLFTIFYTSMFTNGAGFFTGLVGSLGYWLEQQGVQRGSQPSYYYALIQVPVYEYLPMLGTWLAFGIAIWDWVTGGRRGRQAQPDEEAVQLAFPEDPGEPDEALGTEADDERRYEPAPVFPLFGFWAVTSLAAFSVAGEKMPWLTVHITLPAILCSAWALGRLVEATDWGVLRRRLGWLALLLLPVFLVSAFAALGSLLGDHPPFQGKELAQLQATSQFLLSLAAAVASGAGAVYLVRSWPVADFARLTLLSFFALLGVTTTRAAIQANFYAYDDANELLVYAHSAPGVKVALSQIEEISRRTTDGLGIKVAYDNETSYPYWWYLRSYPNAVYFGANPSRSLRDVPIILVGDANYGKIDPVVANLYDQFDYIRLWWPNQDYYDLSWARVRGALANPAMRQALFEIWLNRDYTAYGKALGRDMSLANWSPAARMRLYIRKDITSELWNYGSTPAAVEPVSDPFEGKYIQIPAAAIYGSQGGAAGQFLRPRDVASAPDGSIYVVDTDNNRVQRLAADGSVLQTWGVFGDVTTGAAPGGTFNQPWGIAVSPDGGAVYVADTWNHRIQKFSATGEFQQMWGYFGQAEQPEAMWGPRDVAVDQEGNVYVTDTGNKRVVIFDSNGAYLNQFGEAGMAPGQLDEPVGVALDGNGVVYVADTWNQRVQTFELMEDGAYKPGRSWAVPAWYGQSLDNKPYIAVDAQGSVYVSDPEGYRVLKFDGEGQPLLAFGDFGTGSAQFGMPVGLSIAPDGGIWVADAGNSRVMLFTLP